MLPPEPAAPPPRWRAQWRDRHELFIYYRAAPHDAEALIDAVRTMQTALCAAHPGLVARLLRRPPAEAAQHTWMEAYVAPEGADAQALAAAIELAADALQPWIAGSRHVEHFLACAW